MAAKNRLLERNAQAVLAKRNAGAVKRAEDAEKAEGGDGGKKAEGGDGGKKAEGGDGGKKAEGGDGGDSGAGTAECLACMIALGLAPAGDWHVGRDGVPRPGRKGWRQLPGGKGDVVLHRCACRGNCETTAGHKRRKCACSPRKPCKCACCEPVDLPPAPGSGAHRGPSAAA